MPPTKDYLLHQIKTGNVVHFAGKRCKTVADVEAVFAELEKASPSTASAAAAKKPAAVSKLPPAKPASKDADPQ